MIPSGPLERLVLAIMAVIAALLIGVGYGLWRML